MITKAATAMTEQEFADGDYIIRQVSGWAGSVLLRLPIASCCFLLLLASPARVQTLDSHSAT